MILLTKSNHSYHRLNDPSFSLSSVTQLIKSKQKTNDQSYWDYWLLYKALQKLVPDFNRIKPFAQPPLAWMLEQAKAFPKDLIENLTAEIKANWKQTGEQASEFGTEEHALQEQKSLETEWKRSIFDTKVYKVFNTSEE